MSRYFKSVKSYEDLKTQYKTLLKAYHPDNGGDVSKMQEINVEYDALFKIWKDRKESVTGEKIMETADSTRRQFYTAYGWEGKKHDWNRSLKEVAVIVRTYVKEKYPTYKFSVRTSYASMCQELHVSLKEAPKDIYKKYDELTEKERKEVAFKAMRNFWISEDGFTWDEVRAVYEKYEFLFVYDEVTATMLKDVDNFVKSYNYEDCDGMMDYFHVDFYYFGCKPDDVKIVPRTPRLKKQTSKLAKAEGKEECNKHIPCCGCEDMETCTAKKTIKLEAEEQNTTYTFKVTKGEDTRDGSELWVVRIEERLSREEYISINRKMNEIGGYYSKFKHGFIFRFEPSEKLKGVA